MDLPTNRFDVFYINSVPYLYWIASRKSADGDDRGVNQVWMVAYDASSNTFTAPSVFAESEMPDLQYRPGIPMKRRWTILTYRIPPKASY